MYRRTGSVVQVGLDHRVDHLRRDQHRHRGALLLVALDVRVELVGQEVAERRLELLEVLDGVGALPLGGLPLVLGDVLVARQTRPVRLDVVALEGIREGLVTRVRVRIAVARTDVGRLRMEFHAHGVTSC